MLQNVHQKFLNFINLFLAVLGLHSFPGFLYVASRGYPLAAVRASHYGGFLSCRAQGLGCVLSGCGSQVHSLHGLSCPEGMWAPFSDRTLAQGGFTWVTRKAPKITRITEEEKPFLDSEGIFDKTRSTKGRERWNRRGWNKRNVPLPAPLFTIFGDWEDSTKEDTNNPVVLEGQLFWSSSSLMLPRFSFWGGGGASWWGGRNGNPPRLLAWKSPWGQRSSRKAAAESDTVLSTQWWRWGCWYWSEHRKITPPVLQPFKYL